MLPLGKIPWVGWLREGFKFGKGVLCNEERGCLGDSPRKTSLQTSIYSISSCDRGLLLYLAGKRALLFTSSTCNDELKADAVGDL